MSDFWTTFFYIFVMVAVLIAAYFTTKFISGKSRRVLKSRCIHVLDRLPLGKDKSVALIEVADQTFIIGVTNQSINNLGQIDKEALKNIEHQKRENTRKGFAQKLKDIIINAKDAQENLKKARWQEKTKQKTKYSSEDDYIEQIDRAIQNRQGNMENKHGEMEE